MLRAALRSLLAHKVRLVLSALAIVLGVAFVAGTLMFTDTLDRTFKNLFTSTSADVTVTRQAAFETGLIGTGIAGQPPGVPRSALQTIAGVGGVATANGYIQDEGIYPLTRAGKVLNTGGAPGVGVSWDNDEQLSAMHLVEGRAPTIPDEVAIDTKTAKKLGYAVGDHLRILTPGGAVEATLVGVFRFGETGGLAGASLTAFTPDQATELFGKPDEYSGISILAAKNVSQETLKQRISTALGKGYDVKTRDEQAKDAASEIEQGLKFVNIFLLVFAGIALFVGSFIILNTFSMLVAQRTRELALLRAVGATRRQVTRSVLVEALVLGVVGATAGLAAGYGIASLLRAIFGHFGLTLDGGLVFAARTVVWCYVVGVGVTVVAAYLPARRAARIAPVAAMRADVALPERALRRRAVIGALLLVIGALLLVTGATGTSGSGAAARVGLGGWALVVGTIVISPVIARPFVRGLGSVLPLVWGRTGAIARDNGVRNPRRTAATASALMIGLTLVTAFSVLGSSTNKSIDVLIDRTLGADFVVSTSVQQPFTSEIADKIEKVKGIDAVTRLRFGIAQLDGKKSIVTALDPKSLDRSVKLDYVAGSDENLRGNTLTVDKPTADRRGWHVGSRVTGLFQSGDKRTFEVVGIFDTNQAVGSILMPLDTFVSTGGSTQDRFVYVDAAPGAPAAAVRADLEQILKPYPIVTLKDQTEFKTEQKAQVNQLLLIVNALLVLSIVIAILGIVNTLALSVIERTREIGLLRAIGMARRQLRLIVTLESVVISLYGAVLGMVLGLAFGISLIRSLRSQGIEELAIPVVAILGLVVVAGVVGVLAALWPARRAARLDVLQAIATE